MQKGPAQDDISFDTMELIQKCDNKIEYSQMNAFKRIKVKYPKLFYGSIIGIIIGGLTATAIVIANKK